MKRNLTLLALLITAFLASNAQTVIDTVSIDSAVSINPSTTIPYLDGAYVQVSGTVYGPNQYPTHNGDVFILNNNNNAGIKVYSKHTYGYQVRNGDSVVVVGLMNNYKGQEELDLFDSIAVDTIYFIAEGMDQPPLVVTTIGASNVSQLIEVQNVDMTTATGWQNGTVGYHDFDATATYPGGTLSIYIDSFMNNAMYNATQPQGIYDVVGFGEQYDPTGPPYNAGYEIGPRSMADFILVSSIDDVNPNLQARVFPNPNNGSFFIYLSDNKVVEADLTVMDISGRTAFATHQAADNGRFIINAQTLTPGIYMVEVSSNGEIFRNKIVVDK